jgi:hypothetical protein
VVEAVPLVVRQKLLLNKTYMGESRGQEQRRLGNSAVEGEPALFEQPGLVQLAVDPYQQVRRVRRSPGERRTQKRRVAPPKTSPSRMVTSMWM